MQHSLSSCLFALFVLLCLLLYVLFFFRVLFLLSDGFGIGGVFVHSGSEAFSAQARGMGRTGTLCDTLNTYIHTTDVLILLFLVFVVFRWFRLVVRAAP